MTKIAPYATPQFLDDDGNPLAGGKLYTYEAGTSTPKATYTDSTGNTANANPVVLDSNGRADIWLDTGSYKFTLNTSADVLVKTVDNIVGESVNVFGNTVNSISSSESVGSANKGYLYECTAALTLSLLDVATAGEGFVFGIKNTSGSDVTIDPDGAETINGNATQAVATGTSVLVVCDGTGWKTVFSNDFNVTALSSETIALVDEIAFGDVSDSSQNKKGTVQGIINAIPDSDETTKGLVEKATTAEMTAGTADKFPDAARVAAHVTANAGVEIQRVTAVKTDSFSSASYDAWTDITDMSVDITPSSADNDVRIQVNMMASKAGESVTYYRILRDATPIQVGDSAGSRIQATAAVYNAVGNDNIHPVTIDITDSPASTSEITYKIQFYTDSDQTFYVNRSGSDTNSTAAVRVVSTITASEVR